MPPDEQRGDEAKRHHRHAAAGQPCAEQGRGKGGGQRGKRGQAGRREYQQPDGQRAKTQEGMQRQQNAQGGGHALAALEAEKHRIQVAEEYKHSGNMHGDGGVDERRGQLAGQPHGQPALGQVAQQGEQGSSFLAGAQHVGGARIARAEAARIRQPHQLCHDDGKRQRADQVSAQSGQQGGKCVMH